MELQRPPVFPALSRTVVLLTYDEVTPGPGEADAVVAIAHWLHPAAFGLPPDGA